VNTAATVFIGLICCALTLGGLIALLMHVDAAHKAGRPIWGGRKAENKFQKMIIDPKTAIHEPGICQCNCALSYHKGQGPCQVPGCPCQQFIPSTLSMDELAGITDGAITRMALEGVSARLELEARTQEYHAKAKLLDSQTAQARVKAELSGRASIGYADVD
jgi:hypothetical protein